MNIQHAKKGTIKPIEPFQTLAEEAEFWDTHEATSAIDEGTIVGFHQANKTDTLTIRFSHEDITRLREEAARYNVPVEKMRKELQEHDGLEAFAEQILLGKTLDFLKANVSVETAQEPAVKEEKS